MSAQVEPARRAYDELGVRAIITGRRRSQGGARASIPVVEVDETGLVKVNPLAGWSFAQVRRYVAERGVPTNPLLERGYRCVVLHFCSCLLADVVTYSVGEGHGN